jgi:hypothetical protein
LAKLGISQVCSLNILKIIKEVCFVGNLAKSSEYRGINILALLLILIQVKFQEQEARYGKEGALIDA